MGNHRNIPRQRNRHHRSRLNGANISSVCGDGVPLMYDTSST